MSAKCIRVCAFLFVGLTSVLLFHGLAFGESIRVATYNLDNYLVIDRHIDDGWRKSYPKPESEKAVIRSVIKEAKPDILALQEIGSLPFLQELKADLAQEGIEYPYSVLMQGDDTVRHLAVLSTLAPAEVVRHQDLVINYQGKHQPVKRGMLELSFERPDGDRFKLFVVHLKSRRTSVDSDPESLRCRTLEAKACRNRIIERTFEMEVRDFIIAGDFNDHPESAPLRRFYRRGKLEIGTLVPASDSRGERWTHYYKKEAVYSLVDGFIASGSLLAQVENKRGHIVDIPNVIEGSDHRMVYLSLIQE